jgi:hypothetical protein
VNLISRALRAIHEHPRVSAVALVVYAAAATFPHAQVQRIVSDFELQIGFTNLYRLGAAAALVPGAIFTLLLLWQTRAHPERLRLAAIWFTIMALIVGAWAGLTGNNVELVHYPQYFPEGVALAALTLSPIDAMAWVIVFGGLDEAYQYWVLPRSRVSLYDFNDIYMDLLGGAAGVAFAFAFLYAAKLARTRKWKAPGVYLLSSIVLAGAALWASGLMLLVADKTNPHYWFALGDFQAPSFWAHIVENGPKHYHTLTPVEGISLILVTLAGIAAMWNGEARRQDR